MLLSLHEKMPPSTQPVGDHIDVPQNISPYSRVEQVLSDARNGRMFVIIDDGPGEDHGNIVIPAQMATPATINFMAHEGRGLVCLALTEKRCNLLELKPQVKPEIGLESTFLTSIEARDGVGTGISAADRARTISVAINCLSSEEIVTPGHIFPLKSRDGGVLARAGHTEAAVDVARLAGLNPSAVMCKILNKDGSVARTGDLLDFALQHNFAIISIGDLISYRVQRDRTIQRVGKVGTLRAWGMDWNVAGFFDHIKDCYVVALYSEQTNSTEYAVRFHQLSLELDHISANGIDHGTILNRSIEHIREIGSGAIVFLINSPRSVFDSVLAQFGVFDEDERSEPDIPAPLAAQVCSELRINKLTLLCRCRSEVRQFESWGLPFGSFRII